MRLRFDFRHPDSATRRHGRLAAIVSAAVLAALLTACGTTATSTVGTAGAVGHGKPLSQLKIGYFMTDSTNSYEQAMISDAESAAKNAGASLTMVQSGFNVQTQINQMELALQRKTYNAWVVVLDSEKQECAPVEQAIKQGILVMVGTAPVCETDSQGLAPKGSLGLRAVQVQQTYTEWWQYIMKANPHAQMAVLTGPLDASTTNFTNEQLKAAQKSYPGVDVVANQATDYTTEQAFQATQDLLKSHPDIKVIASNYSGMTQGVVQAVKAAGDVGKVKIYDLLGDKYVVGQIKAGTVTATLPGLPGTESAMAVQGAIQAWVGKPVPVFVNPLTSVKVTDGPFITKANVSQFNAEY